MQTRDHRILAYYLISQSGRPKTILHRFAFIFGCVEPDYNITSYFRGFLHQMKPKGHNAENVKNLLICALSDIFESEFYGALDWFRLGKIIHYLADSFTFPHNKGFDGNLKDHIEYEIQLHKVFNKKLSVYKKTDLDFKYYTPMSLYLQAHEKYKKGVHSMDNDCNCIITVCSTVFSTILHRSFSDYISDYSMNVNVLHKSKTEFDQKLIFEQSVAEI